MALFTSSCKPPILCPRFLRNHAISSHKSISKSFYFGIPAKPINPFVWKAKCCSTLDSSGELQPQSPPSGAIIFIKGLGQSTSNGLLKEAFSQFGEIIRVKLVTDKKTKQFLGFAYVWFTREEHAQSAVDAMNGQFFEGRFIRVEIAKPGSCKPQPKPRPYRF